MSRTLIIPMGLITMQDTSAYATLEAKTGTTCAFTLERDVSRRTIAVNMLKIFLMAFWINLFNQKKATNCGFLKVNSISIVGNCHIVSS